MKGSPLEGHQRDPVFRGDSSATVLLSPDMVIRAATQRYLQVTQRVEDELLAMDVFEAFPVSDATEEAGSAQLLVESAERALRTGRPHRVSTMRYDIPDPERPGEYIAKRWTVETSPIQDGDSDLGVAIRADDLSHFDARLVEALRCYQDALAEGDLRTADSRERTDAVASFLALLDSHAQLGEEVVQLREAVRSRPVIEQAKGIVMADRRCTPEQAFRLIRKLSMDTNVRVADVAAAIVYQVADQAEGATGT